MALLFSLIRLPLKKSLRYCQLIAPAWGDPSEWQPCRLYMSHYHNLASSLIFRTCILSCCSGSKKYWLQYQLLRNITYLWLLVRTTDDYYSVSLTAVTLHPFCGGGDGGGGCLFFLSQAVALPQFTAGHQDSKRLRAETVSFNGERMRQSKHSVLVWLGLVTLLLKLPNLFSSSSVSWIYLFYSWCSFGMYLLWDTILEVAIKIRVNLFTY